MSDLPTLLLIADLVITPALVVLIVLQRLEIRDVEDQNARLREQADTPIPLFGPEFGDWRRDRPHSRRGRFYRRKRG